MRVEESEVVIPNSRAEGRNSETTMMAKRRERDEKRRRLWAAIQFAPIHQRCIDRISPSRRAKAAFIDFLNLIEHCFSSFGIMTVGTGIFTNPKDACSSHNWQFAATPLLHRLFFDVPD